jgi:hypothetical protein
VVEMATKYVSALKGYLRQGNFPLDASSIFDTVAEAQSYAASDSTAYAGQVISIVDELNREVTMYQIGYSDTGLKLEPLSIPDDLVKSINGIMPDENGNIIIDFLDSAEELASTVVAIIEARITFDRNISVPTLGISADDDVITKKYLEAELNDSFEGITRTFKTSFDKDGGRSSQLLPGGSLIQKVILIITQPFDESDITISITDEEGYSTVLFQPTEIFETSPGKYIFDDAIELPELEVGNNGYYLDIDVVTSTKGSAQFYISYISIPREFDNIL